MNTVNLSQDQAKVLNSLVDWHKTEAKNPFITLGGYAGTGKTTLISYLRKLLHKENEKLKVAFCSYTGKATRVLQNKLVANQALYKGDTVGTIHSLIYSPMVDDQENIVGWDKKDEIDADLIIVDEASMVDQLIWNDLLQYGLPIIAVGDHGQLPPINGNFNLMENPILLLDKIHRQSLENPIIKVSIYAREYGKIPEGTFGDKVIKVKKTSDQVGQFMEDAATKFDAETLILCGYNNTRVKLNKFVRSTLGFEGEDPQANDRVICLRNNHQERIFNGMLGYLKSIDYETAPDWHFAQIKMDDELFEYKGMIYAPQFNNPKSLNFSEARQETMAGDLFDFGYAITVHKAQGSEASKVILFEEKFSSMDDVMWARWLYTAVTRAKESLYIIGAT